MAYPYTISASLGTTAGIIESRSDRAVVMEQITVTHNVTGSAKSRWNPSSTTTLRLNVINNGTGGAGDTSSVRWAIIARRVR